MRGDGGEGEGGVCIRLVMDGRGGVLLIFVFSKRGFGCVVLPRCLVVELGVLFFVSFFFFFTFLLELSSPLIYFISLLPSYP